MVSASQHCRPLALTSVGIVSTVAICTWTCILLDDVSPPSFDNLVQYKPKIEDFLIAYGIIAFQFDIHPLLLTIQVDMKDSRKVNSAVVGGFSITITMFAVTALLAANRYGFQVHNNILEGIPPSIPLYTVALLVTIQLCLSSAVGNSALFQHIEDLLKIPRDFCLRRCILRSSIVALAVFLGESVPRFDLVMGLIGSTLTGPLMFILPPLFFLKLCYMKANLREKESWKNNISNSIQNGDSTRNGHQNGGLRNLPLLFAASTKYETFTNYSEIDPTIDFKVMWYDVLLALMVMMVGIIATIVAAYSSWSDTIKYAKFSPPCLINATVAARSIIEFSQTI